MGIEYDNITAFHYASYRPLLHKRILKKQLETSTFDSGLDIGCGTGHSTLALADYCRTVCGIDPSEDMISKGIAHPKVRYSLFDKNHIEFGGGSFNIITLAGSLWYAKSQELLNEIVRVGSKRALVLVYDFDVQLESVLRKIGFIDSKENVVPYDHQEDFSGLNTSDITLIEKVSETIGFQISKEDLAHLVLSVKEQYTVLADVHGANALYNKIFTQFEAISNSAFLAIEATTFCTSYTIN